MKNIIKLSSVLFAFLVTIAASSLKAHGAADQPTGGSCVSTGYCGVTAGGTVLNGYWKDAT